MKSNQIIFDVLTKDELKGIISNSIQEVIKKSSVKEKKEEELLTRDEASNLLKINLSTLWRWTKDGKLSAYGIGNRVFYKKDELLKSLIKIN
jgi:excisionase family DNA binding protein